VLLADEVAGAKLSTAFLNVSELRMFSGGQDLGDADAGGFLSWTDWRLRTSVFSATRCRNLGIKCSNEDRGQELQRSNLDNKTGSKKHAWASPDSSRF
jgi:hypothetical protein